MRYPLNNIAVTQEFGSTAIDYSQFGLRGHHGIDLNASIGTPVFAPESGTILQSANGVTDPKSGRFAAGETIVMSGKYEHWLMHLNQRLVSAGQKVNEGQLIGYTGNTGFTTGPHLHAGTRPLNPDMNNGYRGFINPRGVYQVSTPSAGGANVIPNADNYYGRYNKAMTRIRGRAMSRDEFNKFFVGNTDLRMLEAMLDDPEADNYYALGQWAKANKTAVEKQIADLKVALANEKNKPPLTVIKEVEKIVEKEVIKEVPVSISDEDSAAIKETNSIIKAIQTLLGKVFK
jgi:phosphopantetheinyl transferase (holo-ACP synthase)